MLQAFDRLPDRHDSRGSRTSCLVVRDVRLALLVMTAQMYASRMADERMTASALRAALSDRLGAARHAGSATRVDTRGGEARAMLLPWDEYLRLCAAAGEKPRLSEPTPPAEPAPDPSE